jgi:hypothetical protein
MGVRRTMRLKALLFTALVAIGPSASEAAGSGNPGNDRLAALPSAEQAKALAKNVGHGCVGTSAFAMGVVDTAKWKSLAYWSVQCKDGRSFAIQIDPDPKAPWIITDCRVLQANGKDCFKKF